MTTLHPNKYELNLKSALGRALEREEGLARENDTLKKERKELRKQLRNKK